LYYDVKLINESAKFIKDLLRRNIGDSGEEPSLAGDVNN
jgi:hypothetical protein